MLATVTVKGQVTVPKAIRDQLKIEPGTQLDFKPLSSAPSAPASRSDVPGGMFQT